MYNVPNYRCSRIPYKGLLREILHALFALELILAYFYILDLFKPSYVILFRGATWVRVYRLGLSDLGLYVILTLLAVSLALAVCAHKVGRFRVVKLSRLAYYILVALTVVSGLPLLYWVAYTWSPEPLLDCGFRPYRWVSELDAGLLHVYAPVYPFLLLATIYSWLPPVVGRVFGGRVRLEVGCKALDKANGYEPSAGVLARRLGLVSALLLGVFLPLIPYLPTINPGFRPASVDIRSGVGYSKRLNYMLSTDLWGAVEYAFYGRSGNRPLYLLLLYAITILGVPKEAVLNLEALFIAPMFALAVYSTARRLNGDGCYALLAMLAGLLGFNMTAGMFGGFFATWTALSLSYVCIGLTPSLMDGDRRALALCTAASTMALFMHPWTWSVLMAVLTAYLALQTLKSAGRGRFTVNKSLLTLLIVNAVVDVLKNSVTPGGGGLVTSVETLGRIVGFEDLLCLSRNLRRLSTTYLGGLLFNPLHMLLALIGILSLSRRGDRCSRLTLTWVAVTSA
ncbi:MAG: hypothetical protein DRJ47_07925, partial [Thermoprotei archaeon]